MARVTCVKNTFDGLHALRVNRKCGIDVFSRHLSGNKPVGAAQNVWRTGLRGTCLFLNEPWERITTLHAMEITKSGVPDSLQQNVVSVNDCKRKVEEPDLPKHERSKKRRKAGKQQLRRGERYVPPPQKRNPGVSFSQEHFAETSYYFEGGLRKVQPYYFDFTTYCKGRWIGKTLLEVFKSEFRAESLDYYNEAVKNGRIKLNETPVDDLNIVLKNNDYLRNTVHRHEPPVSGQALEVLVDDGEVVVVDKPASLPVHPCGRYRHNTVIFILGKENGLSGLHTVHRLDRLTSGVLLFARTLEVSKRLDAMVRERQLEKEYVCRVEGEFPEAEVVCEEPILVVSFKVGLCRVDPKGKESRTVFQRMSFNGRSSVVRCRPLTGRTHQIRVHLQFLGFPILNDPIYGSSAWGPNRAKGGLVGISDEQLLEALIEEHRSQESLHLLDLHDQQVSGPNLQLHGDTDPAQTVSRSDSNVCGSSLDHEKPENSGSELKSVSCEEINAILDESPKTQSRVVRDHLCGECKITRSDPKQKDLIMFLHALCYKGPDFEYSTQMPDWAKADWVQD